MKCWLFLLHDFITTIYGRTSLILAAHFTLGPRRMISRYRSRLSCGQSIHVDGVRRFIGFSPGRGRHRQCYAWIHGPTLLFPPSPMSTSVVKAQSVSEIYCQMETTVIRYLSPRTNPKIWTVRAFLRPSLASRFPISVGPLSCLQSENFNWKLFDESFGSVIIASQFGIVRL